MPRAASLTSIALSGFRVRGRSAPGPRYLWPFSFVRDLARDPLGLMNELRAYGDLVRVRAGMMVFDFIFDPCYAKHVLSENHKKYSKEVTSTNAWKSVMDDGLLTAEGESWARQRRRVQPGLNRRRFARFTEAIAECSEAMLDRWSIDANRGTPIDIVNETARLVFRIAARALFSTALDDSALDGIVRVSDGIREYLLYRMFHPLSLPPPIPTLWNLRLRRLLRERRDQFAPMLEPDRRNGGDSMITMLADTDGCVPSSGRIGTFLGAGSETTAVALAWAFYVLWKHPKVWERMKREVDDVLGDRKPRFEDLAMLKYTRMVVEETLRMYPPAYMITRTALERDEIGGFVINRGTTMIVAISSIHHDQRFWRAPDDFEPDRFTPENWAARPDYAFLPFGGGPRACIGEEFAIAEAQTVLATAAQRYRVELTHPMDIHPQAEFFLRPSSPMSATLRSLH